MENQEQRIKELERINKVLTMQNEDLALVASFARDVVSYWPSMTFRTIRHMIPKMDALKEALDLANRP